MMLALWLCHAWLPSPVAAQAAPASQSEYDQALSRALEAHARGDYEAARGFMERAHALEPSARTERGLGIVAFAQAKHLSAIRHFDAALASNFKPLPDDLRAATSELLAHAWALVSRAELSIEPEGAELTIDGSAPDYYAPNVVVLTPGRHTLTVQAEGRAPYQLALVARAGESRLVQVVLAVPPPPSVVEKVVYRAPTQGPGKELAPSFYSRPVRLATSISGGVLLAAGGTLWTIGALRLDNVRESCRPQGCTESEAQRRFDRDNIGTFATTGLIVGGLGLATLVAVGAIEIWQLKQKSQALSVDVSAAGIAMNGQF